MISDQFRKDIDPIKAAGASMFLSPESHKVSNQQLAILIQANVVMVLCLILA
jgi:hypothetical protein